MRAKRQSERWNHRRERDGPQMRVIDRSTREMTRVIVVVVAWHARREVRSQSRRDVSRHVAPHPETFTYVCKCVLIQSRANAVDDVRRA